MREFNNLVEAREAAKPGDYLLFCVKRPVRVEAGLCTQSELEHLPSYWHVFDHIPEGP